MSAHVIPPTAEELVASIHRMTAETLVTSRIIAAFEADKAPLELEEKEDETSEPPLLSVYFKLSPSVRLTIDTLLMSLAEAGLAAGSGIPIEP